MEKGNSILQIIGKNKGLINNLNWMSFFGLSVTTLFTTNIIAGKKLQDITFLEGLVPFLSIIIAFAVMQMFDGNLRKNVISAIQAVLSKDWKTSKTGVRSIGIFFLLIAVIRFGLSSGATFISGYIGADELTEDVSTEGIEKLYQDREATIKEITLTTNRQINDVRKDAERRASEIIETAIYANGKNWAKNYKRKNSWFMNGGKDKDGKKSTSIVAYLNNVKKAEAKAEKIREEANKQIAKLTNDKTNLIASAKNDKGIAKLTEMKEKQIAKAERREWYLSMGLWSLDFLFGLIALVTSVFLAVFLNNDDEYELFREEETSFLSIIKEGFLSRWRVLKARGIEFVSKLDLEADEIITNIGETVTINARTVAMKRRNVSRNAETDKREDSRNELKKKLQKPVSNDFADDYLLLTEKLNKAKGNVRSYRSKIKRNEGNASTNERGLQKWMAAVESIEAQLQNYN